MWYRDWTFGQGHYRPVDGLDVFVLVSMIIILGGCAYLLWKKR